MSSREQDKIISDLLLRIYDPPEKNNFFDHVLSVLETCMPSALTGYTSMDMDSGVFTTEKIHRVSSEAQNFPSLSESDQLVLSHPFIEHYRLDRKDAVLCTTDIMSMAAWESHTLYNELWRPNGMLFDTSVRFYEGATCHAFFFTSESPLTEDARRSLDFIAPHLASAYRSFKVREKMVLEKFPGTRVFLSTEGLVSECPSSIKALLKHYYPHEKKDSARGLPDEVEDWIQAEIKTFPTLAGTSWGGRLIARRSRSILSMSLLKIDEGFMLLFEESVSVRIFDVLLKMGLTPRESEVMQWICQGKQNSEIALILKLSTATIRKHVEHILLKLYSETRGAAVQRVMRVLNEQIVGIEPEDCSVCARPICLFCDD